MRNLIVALALCFLAFAGGAYADDVTPSESVVTGVVVRAAPSTQADRLGLLRPEETLDLDGEAPGWWRVRLDNGAIGFVSKRWTLRVATPPPPPIAPLEASRPAMFVHFVNVGQGAGAILEFPCGVAVIDTGGQYNGPYDGGFAFVDYLEAFFAAHPERQDTIDVLFTTHPHADHLKGLAYLLDEEGHPRFTIRNVVDNGQSGSSGSLARQRDFRQAARGAGAGYQGVAVAARLRGQGLSNEVIDPLDCSPGDPGDDDPSISVLWGGWSASSVRGLGGEGRDAQNANQHSLVVRVQFGDATFLFTGDLEEEAIHDLLAVHRADLSAFDVDVYEVGHHGSGNATTPELMAAMTPRIAVISAGNLDYAGSSSATDHGHPRREAVELLQSGAVPVSDTRAPFEAWVFEGQDIPPVAFTVSRAIYSTGWEAPLVLRATTSGDYAFVDAPH